MNWNAADTAVHPVHTRDGQYFIELPGGEYKLVTLLGRPAELPEGWTPRFLYTGLESVYLLELIHETGAESTWFLHPSMERIAFDHPEDLPPVAADAFRLQGSELLRRLWQQLICARDVRLTADVSGFLLLGDAIRNRIRAFCESGLNITPRTFDPERAFGHLDQLTLRDGTTLRIDKLREILVQDLPATICSCVPSGTLRWESPLGGRTILANKGLWLSHYNLAYRLVDDRGGPVFYAITSSNPVRVVGIYVPGEDLVFRYHIPLQAYFHLPIETIFLRHICEFGPAMERAWREPVLGFSAVYSSPLISAQMWHDLTGIDRMARDIPREYMPEILGMWGLPEVYGDTEELYPETIGHINRSFKTLHAETEMIKYAYQNQRCIIKMTHTYVTKNLYSRVTAHNINQPALTNHHELLRQIRARGCPLILLGIRVESRTAVDLPEFCERMIDFLIRECGEVAIVIDAHNSARSDGTDAVFQSEFQHLAKEQPIDVERRIVGYLRQRFQNRPLILIDNIGAPMSHSIFWCHFSDFFVTFYGTGLAKYRWACNQTGLIITSQWTLRNQPHLHIYEAGYIEDPSPLRFLPEQYVTDDPDDPVLVPEPGNPPSRWNFRINDEGVFAELREFLTRSRQRGH